MSSMILLIIYFCTGDQTFYYSVAVIKKNTLPGVQTLHDLRGKKACFAGVGTLAGWVIPVYKVQCYSSG
jgi:ABC-type phosphate/phosphonate transport system, periplasmic component